MFCQRLLRLVRKSGKFCLDVRVANCIQRIDENMMMRGVFTVPPASRAEKPKTVTQSDSNGPPKLQPAHPREATIEELVFYPGGRQSTSSDQDAMSLALENDAYNAAIKELTTLQTNKETINISISDRKLNTINHTMKYLERSGLTLPAVEQLSIIHVAGTKGKGSTCALTESILRQYGARTGFFSSPHLLSTNERIRINGDPLAKRKFTEHFWRVYNRLCELREDENDMPGFFMFLTILSFHVFLAERVDVVVLEVGIGGELDCTNIVRNVRTAGITSLALEHMLLLGDTLPQIAWQKAGIIKPGAHVYTHVIQPECLQVIRERAAACNAHVIEVLSTEAYFKNNLYSDYLDSCNDYVKLNAALAIQLAYDWLRQTTGHLHCDYAINEPKMSAQVLRGLSSTHWPGRCQMVEYQNMRLHLDGAHTVESIKVCCDWFRKSTKQSVQNPKILIFNRTGDSDTRQILMVLQQACVFDMVCFVPNLATTQPVDPNQTTGTYTDEAQRQRAQAIASNWQLLCDAGQQPNRGQYYNTVWAAFDTMCARYNADIQLDVLVTGSIHLLGNVIVVLNMFHRNQEAPQSMAAAATTTPTNGHN